ncbi:MAG: peptide-binding protein [Rhodobacteraceae bacterium]|nr:peptide-binding protein [Paracoccaceae bacterium]
MRRTTTVALAAMILGTSLATGPATAAPLGRHVVQGVEDGDMLKMREGPGTGYSVIVGLPNETVVRVHECQQAGSTNWCKVSLDRARGLKGYVSYTYLRKM